MPLLATTGEGLIKDPINRLWVGPRPFIQVFPFFPLAIHMAFPVKANNGAQALKKNIPRLVGALAGK